jgi:hypothetical protein
LHFIAGAPISVDVGTEVVQSNIAAMDYQTREILWHYLDPQPMMEGT